MNEPENSSSKIPPETPRPLRRPMPVWLVILLSLLVYRGVLVVDEAGGFDARVFPPYRQLPPQPEAPTCILPPRIDRLYSTYCAICHQPAGQGMNGMIPKLSGSEWVQAENPERLIRIVLYGLQGPVDVNGQRFDNAMPPWKEALSDEDVACILTYIRSSWGNSAPPVTAAEVKYVREAEANRNVSWSADELLKLPAK